MFGDASFGAIGGNVSMLVSVTFEGALGLGSWSHTSSVSFTKGGAFLVVFLGFLRATCRSQVGQ